MRSVCCCKGIGKNTDKKGQGIIMSTFEWTPKQAPIKPTDPPDTIALKRRLLREGKNADIILVEDDDEMPPYTHSFLVGMAHAQAGGLCLDFPLKKEIEKRRKMIKDRRIRRVVKDPRKLP